MAPRFEIETDAPRKLMRITLAGFFAAEDIQRFSEARDRGLRAMGLAPNAHRTLVDIRDMDIQSQDSVRVFQQVLNNPATTSDRLAFVVARSLSRMQVKRAADTRDAHYFSTIEEAEAFLLG